VGELQSGWQVFPSTTHVSLSKSLPIKEFYGHRTVKKVVSIARFMKAKNSNASRKRKADPKPSLSADPEETLRWGDDGAKDAKIEKPILWFKEMLRKKERGACCRGRFFSYAFTEKRFTQREEEMNRVCLFLTKLRKERKEPPS